MKCASTTAFRLLALMLCMAMTIPQLQAATWTVAGTSNGFLLNQNWDPTYTGNDMTQYGTTTYYYLARTANVNSGSYAFKVVKDRNWNTAYPGSDYGYSVSSTGTWSIVYIFNTSGNAVSLFGPFKTLTVAGSQTEILGSSWDTADSNNDMTSNDGIVYKLTFTDVNVTAGTYKFKVAQDHAWTNAWPSSDKNYTIGFTGVADVEYTFNVITKDVNVTVTEKSVTPVTPDYYITGDTGLGLSGWSYNQFTTMTYDEANNVYTYSYNVTSAGTYYFAFADGAGSSWDDFNGNHRYGPSSGNEDVDLNGGWSPTQKGGGSYAVTVDAGQVTITLDVAHMQYKVEGTELIIPTDYYVKGADTNIFPDGWSTSSNTAQMSDNGDGTYSWTSGEFHLDAGTNYTYKVYDSKGQWHPQNSGNQTFSSNVPGTYTVTITYDSNNETLTATLNPIQPDPQNTFNIYVRYMGTEDVNNVYMHAWDANGDKTTWPGLAFANMTRTVINGHTYYTISYTGYISQIGLLFNENGSNDTKTADLTATPGDNYFTYYGGSIVDGPNAQADAAITSMYIIGMAGSQQWAANAGIAMEYDNATGYYTAKNVVLTANSHFAFATELGSNSDDWTTLNAHRYSSAGNSHWAINESWLNKWMLTKAYVDDNHNWFVEQSSAYDIEFNPDNERVRVKRSHDKLYISYGQNWTYQDNSLEMTTVDGNIYQATITLNQGDFFLFSTALSDETAMGATSSGYEITNLMIGFAQMLQEGSTDNFCFTGTTGKYIVVVNLDKGTVTLRKTADVSVTKVFLQKTDNVVLDPAGGTYQGQTLEGKRGGIYAWNKLNLESAGSTYSNGEDGSTNYTYLGEVMINDEPYSGNDKLKDLPDTTTVDGKQWYAWSIGNSICEFYFIRNNKTDYKSQKVLRRAGEVWLIWLDEDATSDRQDNAQHLDSLQNVTSQYYDVTASGVSDVSTMLEDHYYAYYTNTTGWDSVYCYAWCGDPFIEFTSYYPGNKCTFVGYDEDGYEVWCYDFGLMEDFHRTYGIDENTGDYIMPTGIIFDNGIDTDEGREQTGDLVFDNGACYDYLGMVYLGNSLNGIIAGGIVNGPKYTVEDNLIGVYYDEDAITEIMETDSNGNPVLDEHGNPKFISVRGALYAKDMENYSAKSVQPDGTLDYVYQVCKHKVTASTPGGSQIQIKRDHYDQSNWVKIVLSPNFDNTHLQNTDVTYDKTQFDQIDFSSIEQNDPDYLTKYVGKIIPGGSMSGNLVSNVNPQMHITNIAKPLATDEYEKNVYVTSNFNDSVVFSYVHQDWSPGIYNGVYRTVPVWTTVEGETFVDHMRVDDTPTKLFYVAPKPQEVAYITWAVFDHPDPNVGTRSCEEEPSVPGAFYAPMNWDRTGQLWDGTEPLDQTGNMPYGTTYGPISNGFMQYAAFQVNWSLFEDMSKPITESNRSQQPWYQIFKPGHAYKILALVRYAYGDKPENVEYTAGVFGDGETYNNGSGNHVSNAPRRVETMDPAGYDNLNDSKFIVFPLKGSSNESYGDDLGDVTAVEEVKYVPTSKDIVSVRYYNMMGIGSNQPFDGMNIVVTTYNDGSRTSKKILR